METRAPWFVVGPLIGVLVIGLLWTINKPFGALGGFIDLNDWISRRSKKIGWRALFVGGVVLGGLAHALLVGSFYPTLAYGWLDGLGSPVGKLVALSGAGLLMGYGARTAGGCTSGHGVCGTALASPASYVSTMTFMATAVLAANATAWLFGGGQ